MKRDLSVFMGALAVAAALAAPALAVAAEPATSPDVIAQFPDTLTDSGKQFLERCSDEQLAAAADPVLESSRCQALYRQWFAETGEPMPRQERSRTLQPNIPFRSVVRMTPTRAL
ncbi:hypothetical protein ACFONC_08045 [Luteimonas soli]|uniref:Uncharacterized protein n=1 Tax=Luteimonas soli TaxID=1648966 RepID=A0ABV7XMT0_9GAMM